MPNKKAQFVSSMLAHGRAKRRITLLDQQFPSDLLVRMGRAAPVWSLASNPRTTSRPRRARFVSSMLAHGRAKRRTTLLDQQFPSDLLVRMGRAAPVWSLASNPRTTSRPRRARFVSSMLAHGRAKRRTTLLDQQFPSDLLVRMGRAAPVWSLLNSESMNGASPAVPCV